jgi:hypothetical protein
LLNPCIDNTALVVKVNKAPEVNIGQGDGDTRWKGWPWKLLLIELLIVCYYHYLLIFSVFLIPSIYRLNFKGEKVKINRKVY